ncbi:hypothetical protein [Robertkochia sediminum]|uniref:hypothetical protein n=1 Tax=Robertkochia sediminum TaxID=2785326 RepID=UPI001933B81F|nr:hypothetical protein [Robertkochia sediminum]MBL7473625.1 hypothetical protein [Robertkochia sediminum]
MKKLFSLLALFSLVLISCEGDPGPPGPPGQDGLDGLIGTVFEYEVTFRELNTDVPVELFDFPGGVEVFDSDVVLAYVLIDVIEGVDVWEPLPRTLYFNDGGILSYGFNYTAFDIQFFLDGNVNYPTLDVSYTDNLIMRVAVVPAELLGEIDINDFSKVMSVAKMINNQDIVIE